MDKNNECRQNGSEKTSLKILQVIYYFYITVKKKIV